jgi:hypothetical protein
MKLSLEISVSYRSGLVKGTLCRHGSGSVYNGFLGSPFVSNF